MWQLFPVCGLFASTGSLTVNITVIEENRNVDSLKDIGRKNGLKCFLAI